MGESCKTASHIAPFPPRLTTAPASFHQNAAFPPERISPLPRILLCEKTRWYSPQNKSSPGFPRPAPTRGAEFGTRQTTFSNHGGTIFAFLLHAMRRMQRASPRTHSQEAAGNSDRPQPGTHRVP